MYESPRAVVFKQLAEVACTSIAVDYVPTLPTDTGFEE